MSKGDDFDDIDHTLGVLGGLGSEELEKVVTVPKPSGIVSKCTCGQCSRQCEVTISYEEAVIGSLKLMPPQWDFDQKSGSIYPSIACGACPYLLKLLFTPRELHALVQRAEQEGFVSRGQVQAWISRYAPMAAQRR